MLLHVLGGNVCCGIFYVAMCVAWSFRWQCVLFGLLCNNVCSWVFKWQSEKLGLLGNKVSSWVF